MDPINNTVDPIAASNRPLPVSRRPILLGAFATVLALLGGVLNPVHPLEPANAATVGSGGCIQTVDNSAGVSVLQIGNDCVVTFASGVRTWTVPTGVVQARYLIVAGGGAGGDRGTQSGGGGGGGGVLSGTRSVSGIVSLTVGSASQNSRFDGLTATRGGKGGDGSKNGQEGGSGGGGGSHFTSRDAGTGTLGQGNAGGAGRSSNLLYGAGGGGGGAGATGDAGGNGPNNPDSRHVAGSGGAGFQSNISGTHFLYGSGGGGGAVKFTDTKNAPPTSDRNSGGGGTKTGGGIGGRQVGSLGNVDATAGENGFGGGGGGGTYLRNPGVGGSGVVIVRYTIPATFTINYNANQASSGSTPSNQTKTQNVNLTLATNTGLLSRTGFDFIGWNTQADGLGLNYAAGATYTVEASDELFAQWGASYALTLNSQGTTTSQQLAAGGSPADPLTLRTGFTLVGWSDEDDGTAEYLANLSNYLMPSAHDTLFAVWVANPVISVQPESLTLEVGQSATLNVVASVADAGTISYVWQRSTNGSDWTSVGSNLASFSIPSLALADNGVQYRVQVTNTLNGKISALTSDVASISVTGIAVTSGDCTAMVAAVAGVTLGETPYGSCLLQFANSGSNTFFVPNLVSSVQAIIIGGGGGGGGANFTLGGGGGGGGAVARLITLAVTSSQQLEVVVGSGGGGGAANQPGSDGHGSSVGSGTEAVGGKGGRAPTNWPGGGGAGGAGGYSGGTGGDIFGAYWGGNGGAGATDPGLSGHQQARLGSGGSSLNFAGQFWCVGGGAGGGNREVSSDAHFHWEPRSRICSDNLTRAGGSGGWHNGTTNILPTFGQANRGGGGGGGSYDRSTNTARGGSQGSDGLVAIYFTLSTGDISLSGLDAISFSNAVQTMTLTKDNTSSEVVWSSSNQAVCTVTGDATTGSITPVAAGVCVISVTMPPDGSYARGSANSSFVIDKITRSAPSWLSSALSVPFGGSLNLHTNITSPGGNVYGYSTSGTAESCTVTGSTLKVGQVGDNCNVVLSLLGDAIYLDVEALSPLSIAVTKVSQSALVVTSGSTMQVNQTLDVSAAGGSGDGILSYHVASAGGTGCNINNLTGVLSASSAGTCSVFAKRAASTNFDEAVSATLEITVNRAAQTLSWLSQPQANYLPGNTYVLEASATSQLAVGFGVVSGLCTLSGNTVTLTGSGDCVLEAGQAGDASFVAAITISQTVSVGKINQTMTFSPIAARSWGSLAFELSATSSSALEIVYTENNQTTNDACDVSANGIVTVKHVGSCAVTATQAGNSVFTTVAITRFLEVTANQAGAPFIGSISFGNRQLNASFFTPSYLGGGTISAYELHAYELDGTLASTNTGCAPGVGPIQSCSVTGLDNGKRYVLRVAAITQAGAGELSASSSEMIPASNPEAVGNLIAMEGNGTLTLQWTEPASFGGGAFSQYRIYWRAPGQQYQPDAAPGATVAVQSSTSHVITGLTNGVGYDVKIVTATSNNNVELQSNTAEVRQTPFTVPDAPGQVVALHSSTNIVISWQQPEFDGGNPIDQYVVEKDGAAVCTITSATATRCEVTRPASGTTSVVEVRARNEAGLSAPATTTITIQAAPILSQPGTSPAGAGETSFPGVVAAALVPSISGVSGSATVNTNDLVRLVGTDFANVTKVLVGGVEASFFVNSAGLITIRIPMEVAAGKPTITLQGTFGSRIFTDLIEVSLTLVSIDTKVTIGTFLGYAAVYTKNHEGKRLSMKIGSKWRVIDPLSANYTRNLTRVGVGRTVTVMVYLDRELVQVKQIKIQ